MYKDPFLEYEELLLREIHRPSTVHRFFWVLKFLSLYLILSGTIFSILLGAMNFSAYSNRVLSWIDPSRFDAIRSDLEWAIQKSSIEVHASDATHEEQQDSVELITEKMAAIEPGIVYNRNYSPSRLLWNIMPWEYDHATFQVTPYENRIIIPKLGKNIPLIDVNHDSNASFSEMHEVFMEELKKWIVRYPGTARPGEVGNAFIFWHSSNYPWIQSQYNDVFALLDTLVTGDEIIVFYNQKKWIYKITDRAIVKPGDMKTLNARDPYKKELSLMTCWPVGTTLERIILFAELVEDTK
jgi:LPXTG-site transpeptidase (sortase) family protein